MYPTHEFEGVSATLMGKILLAAACIVTAVAFLAGLGGWATRLAVAVPGVIASVVAVFILYDAWRSDLHLVPNTPDVWYPYAYPLLAVVLAMVSYLAFLAGRGVYKIT